MKLNELKNKEVMRAMPMGKHEVTFVRIEYRTDQDDNVTGAWIYITEYKPLYIPIFDGENFQLDLLTEQLGVESYDPDEINKCQGTKIIAHKYLRTDVERQQDFTNISFNPRYREPDETPLAQLA